MGNAQIAGMAGVAAPLIRRRAVHHLHRGPVFTRRDGGTQGRQATTDHEDIMGV